LKTKRALACPVRKPNLFEIISTNILAKIKKDFNEGKNEVLLNF